MTIEYLKKAEKNAATGEDDTRKIVADMLGAIEAGGEAKAREYAKKLDGWDKDIVLSRAEIDATRELVPAQARRDIEFAHQRVKAFAEAQLASMSDFETELSPGLVAGQRLVPVNTARISRSEGMEGHARTGDDRLYKYFPGEDFDLGIE